ncbi:MAG TPA: dTDP-4-dehydrorhamnose 3,5-epimerase family protein [Candidatus Polarisedimenticolia bacterium]|nr:dTDP-4-dehydrorhamnose 3,5-epimerase family protein [Candidatus Polarisedimenticolia bacterium]
MMARPVAEREKVGEAPLIDGVRQRRLKVIPDERGRLMEMLRRDDDIFIKFGQAYLTTAYPGVVKGWHYHKVQHDHFIVVKGMMKIVLYDAREDSPTHGVVNEFFMGEHNPLLLQIPPYVYHGFKCISPEEALVINLPTEPYEHGSPDEFRVGPHDPSIPYDWSRHDG